MAVDRKYGKVTVEKEPGTPLGDDEPVFVLRGNDVLAINTLQFYINDASGKGAQAKLIDGAIEVKNDFLAYQDAHPDKVKMPD